MALDLHDLLLLFESEPKVDESDVPWDYSGAIVTFTTANDEVRCRLAPGDGVLALVWRQGGVKRVEMSLAGYFDMKIEQMGADKRFVAISNEEGRSPFVLQLRPHVFVAMGAA